MDRQAKVIWVFSQNGASMQEKLVQLLQDALEGRGAAWQAKR